MHLNHHDSELTKHLIVEKDKGSTATPGSVCSKSEATAHTKSIEDRQSEMQRRLEHRASLMLNAGEFTSSTTTATCYDFSSGYVSTICRVNITITEKNRSR